MTNRQVALILAVVIRYFTKVAPVDLFDQAQGILDWLDSGT